jgi:hypothetical protein
MMWGLHQNRIKKESKRNRLSFSIKTFLLITTLTAVGVYWYNLIQSNWPGPRYSPEAFKMLKEAQEANRKEHEAMMANRRAKSRSPREKVTTNEDKSDVNKP